MVNNMIDIHSHIVFDVDDGAIDFNESMNMLKESYVQGVRTVIATPHFHKKLFNYDLEKIKINFFKLREASKKYFPELELYLGTEVFCYDNIFEIIEKKEFLTINNTDYVLVEFAYGDSFNSVHSKLNAFFMNGYVPIIAHIERYENLNINDFERLVDGGCYLQINSSSLLKKKLFDTDRKYKSRARKYLKNNLVHFVSSDMHNTTNRKTFMKNAFEECINIVGEEYSSEIFFKNAERVIKGIEI